MFHQTENPAALTTKLVFAALRVQSQAQILLNSKMKEIHKFNCSLSVKTGR